ncbi:steroidogenic acute regulatory protein-like [Musca vetustissima]|uniref:steroidogenic acute regulatory protein-like n=1 Tax=Musca vetustissima TaxID=27455 RepID=UPI002AB6B3BC|nr:steroidogenic acute regulatory protein-like [Musca vetustissima]
MSQNSSEDLRSAAELLINQARAMQSRGGGNIPYDISRTHSINLITEEFLGGYMQDGRMSVVRRFFCLFVTFDLFFVSLLWLICIMLNGDNIFVALQKQIVHYTIEASLFDVVAAAICRFVVLIFFYALLYVNNWFIIALSTSGSCLFLISKVFVFDWVKATPQVFEVILIITSFVLAWGEAWFLDCRVIPQERHARRYFAAMTSSTDRSPLMAPFLSTQNERRPADSVVDFYSPLDSAHNSDEEEEKDEDYHKMGLDCVRRTYDMLHVSDWKVEKVTKKGDTISSIHREKMGKIYKLTCRLKYPAKALCHELFYKIEDMPLWNPTTLESKMVRKINSYTDITYNVSAGSGGGMIKSRDFVNLRCWRLVVDGKICDESSLDPGSSDEEMLNNSCEGSVSTISDGEGTITPQPSSVGSCRTSSATNMPDSGRAFNTLSKSLGAKDFSDVLQLTLNTEPPPLDDEFEDAKDHIEDEEKVAVVVATKSKEPVKPPARGRVWVNAAISVEYDKIPVYPKYTRGENLVSGFAMHEVESNPDVCIFEWILCIDLKGYIPRYVLDSAYTTFMTDYITYLRKYIKELRERRRRRTLPRN